MHIFRNIDAPARPADSNSFVGPATTKLLASSEQPDKVHVYRVVFESGARTNWHTHSGAQWLFVVEGRIRAQSWGDKAIDVEAGDAIVFAPGEKHWHGAVPGERGAHLAVNINVTTDWLEPVSDADYGMEP
ncbi:MAG TPA: cupin domain-containing protein [Vicinamibacterales bacterium]|jgi:quercetin dioxygenase-like cupin family protein|nr:cupin domain-containing protein [Vicinamibacterales bacterium]